MTALIECVPNFSEGRNPEIRQITTAIEAVDGATLLHLDPGKATNRTVVTLAGPPEDTVAFERVRTALAPREAAILATVKSKFS